MDTGDALHADTAGIRSVGSELVMLAGHWLATPSVGRPVPDAPTALGGTALGSELSLGLATFTRRAQEAVRQLGLRMNSSGEALFGAAATFERTESSIAATAE